MKYKNGDKIKCFFSHSGYLNKYLFCEVVSGQILNTIPGVCPTNTMQEKFKRIEASSFLSKHEKNKLSQKGPLIEKSKQLKRGNFEVEKIVTTKHVSKKSNVESSNSEIQE